jgi:uncharacterized protein YqeY
MIIDQIESDFKEAMKAKDAARLSALRMLKSALSYAQIEKGKSDAKLPDDDVMKAISKQIKQRKDSIDSYVKANRTDLAQKEEFELKILERYLPAQMNNQDLEILVKKVIGELGATSKKDTGRIMKAVMDQAKA